MTNVHDLYILNLDETGREWIDYTLDEGYEFSKPYDTWEEAQQELNSLTLLNQDPSVYISVKGTHIYKEHYIQLVYKYRTLNS